jgi:hypothetical protein
MFWQRRDTIAARVGKWKWVVMGDRGGLFDLQQDIGETTDLSQQRPDVLQRVQARYRNWREQMEAAEPRRPFRDF